MAVREWLLKQEADFYGDGIFELVPNWGKCINVLWDYAEKLRYFNGINELQLT
jgi:hypothetical protein